MKFDVFISHSTKDKTTADAACAALEAAGVRSWIAPRDIRPGADWGEAIVAAIENCRVMVLIFSASANESPQIPREIERAGTLGKPIVPVRIESVTPSKSLAYYLSSLQWLDALTPPVEQHFKHLCDVVKALLLVRDKSTSDGDAAASTSTAIETDARRPVLALPDKPSIAVLPFENMSGDPEQEYFTDGTVDDIITGLSRIKWLFVIARNSTFTYKGRAIDVKQVGRELGVRYVLEGSVRKAANRVRITGQLIDASTGTHLWADRFEGTLNDIFDLQDQVATSVVGAIAPQLEHAEIARAKRKPTESLDAYDYYLRGMAYFHQRTKEAINQALPLFYKAIELDPDYASACGMAAQCYFWRKINGWMTDRTKEIDEGVRLARRAVELGKDDAVALARGGHSLAHLSGDYDSGIAYIDRALVLNPNLAVAWHLGGFLRVFSGDPEGAIEHLAQHMRLSPLDPEIFRGQAGMAFTHFFAGRFDEALSWAEKAIRELPSFLSANSVIAASHALAGRTEEAHQAMQRVRQLDPTLRVSNVKDWFPLRRPEDLARFEDGLRKAGLPE